MAGGRPTKLNDDVKKKSIAYINGGYIKAGDVIPSNEGLADLLGVVTKTLYNWSDADEEFLHILAKLQEKQRRVLINSGLSNEFNSNIAKLVLGKHGYHDKGDYDLSNKDKTLRQTTVIDASKLTDEQLLQLIGDGHDDDEADKD